MKKQLMGMIYGKRFYIEEDDLEEAKIIWETFLHYAQKPSLGFWKRLKYLITNRI